MKSLLVPRLRRAAVAAGVLLGLAVTGCANAEPGVVAYVGDERITQAQLEDAVTGLGSTLEAGQTVSSEAVVNALIQGKIAERIAAAQNIPLTDAARNAVLKGSTLEPLVNVPAAREVAYDVADSQIVSQQVGAEAYLADVQASDVTLNPRYGVLDPAQKTIVSGQTGSLSEPADPVATP